MVLLLLRGQSVQRPEISITLVHASSSLSLGLLWITPPCLVRSITVCLALWRGRQTSGVWICRCPSIHIGCDETFQLVFDQIYVFQMRESERVMTYVEAEDQTYLLGFPASLCAVLGNFTNGFPCHCLTRCFQWQYDLFCVNCDTSLLISHVGTPL